MVEAPQKRKKGKLAELEQLESGRKIAVGPKSKSIVRAHCPPKVVASKLVAIKQTEGNKKPNLSEATQFGIDQGSANLDQVRAVQDHKSQSGRKRHSKVILGSRSIYSVNHLVAV